MIDTIVLVKLFNKLELKPHNFDDKTLYHLNDKHLIKYIEKQKAWRLVHRPKINLSTIDIPMDEE